MFKTLAISTVIATAASLATANPDSTYDLSVLPADVAARVMQLQAYGDRFEPTIAAIVAEHTKPVSNWGSTEYDLSLLPEDVAEQVIVLLEHGDRFELVIRAIFAQHVKPVSSFDLEFAPTEDQMTDGPQS